MKILEKRPRVMGISYGYFECPSCGAAVERQLSNGKRDKSCGCQRKYERHGLSRGESAKLYAVWSSMRHRCECPTDAVFKYYGGRGISVCSEWQSFGKFYKWASANGYAWGLQIDRRDNNGNYEPENCRFVTPRANNRNRRDTKLNEGAAIELRRRFAAGESATDLGREYNICRDHARRIGQGKFWRPEHGGQVIVPGVKAQPGTVDAEPPSLGLFPA